MTSLPSPECTCIIDHVHDPGIVTDTVMDCPVHKDSPFGIKERKAVEDWYFAQAEQIDPNPGTKDNP